MHLSAPPILGRMPNSKKRCLSALLAVSLLSLAACSIQLEEPDEPSVRRSPLEQSAASPQHSELSTVIEQVLPAVVNVRVESISLSDTAPPVEGSGEGSGVVIDPDGIILTNYHVVAGAVEVRVVFTDERDPLEGRVIGGDPDRDLAVIEVEADDLQAIEVGRSGDLKLGDGVVAIGFPLGLGGDGASASPTVTSGILSGTERTIRAQGSFGIERLVGLLQTDAAINPGNSGGPLVNLDGRVVGINTAGVQAAAAENIGFAIAIDRARLAIEEAIEDPAAPQPYMGVSTKTVTDLDVEQFGLPVDQGALVVDVAPGGPADQAGISPGDVIVDITERPIASTEEVGEAIREHEPGEPVDVTVVHPDGEDEVIEVTLGARPIPIGQG